MTQGGTTAEVMGHILKMEADFRVLLVTLNAQSTTLNSEAQLQNRNALYPNFGYLYPEGSLVIRKSFNEATLRTALEPYSTYLELYNQVKDFYDTEKQGTDLSGVKSMEDLIYEKNVEMYELAFEQQYHFGIFYAWVKLREQEIRNINWIASMLVLKYKERIEDVIKPIFRPRM